MNRHFLNILMAIIILLTSCQIKNKSKYHKNLQETFDVNRAVDTNRLSTFDTTIILSGIVHSTSSGIELNDQTAQAVLYTHFKNKGYFTADSLPTVSKLIKKNEEKLSVEFDKIYKINLNNDRYSDAVITYWLTPIYANGHCWQPHKAIILNTDNGYQITNEEFIPDNYAIDSVSTALGKTIIYGYDYDCAHQKTLKNIKVHLVNNKTIK